MLPPIPTNVSVVSMEQGQKRKAKVSWLLPHHRSEEQIDYVVEARAHVGSSFSKHKLSQWFVINAENLTLEPMHSQNTKCVCKTNSNHPIIKILK